MPFEFHEANCVIAGTFNIYIVRPDWLGKIGVVPEGTHLQIETRLDRPGFRLSLPSGSRWDVMPDRLMIQSDSPTDDCGEMADKILESLPWTPLMAVGCNVALRGDISDVDGWEEKTGFPPIGAVAEFELKQRTWHTALWKDGRVFNLQLSRSEDKVELRANAHTELHNDIDFARQTARSFLEQRSTAIMLFEQLFGARIGSQ